VHPTVTIEDCLEAEEIVKADPGIIKLLRERYGLTPERVAFDPWYYGDRCARPHSSVISSSPALWAIPQSGRLCRHLIVKPAVCTLLRCCACLCIPSRKSLICLASWRCQSEHH